MVIYVALVVSLISNIFMLIYFINKKGKPTITKKCPDSNSTVDLKVKIGDIGLYHNQEYIDYYGSNEMLFSIIIEVIDVFENGEVKAKISEIISEVLDNESDLTYSEKKSILKLFHSKYYVGNEILIYSNSIHWKREVSLDGVVINNKDLSTLVKFGKVIIDDVEVKLGEYWDYSNALNIIIES